MEDLKYTKNEYINSGFYGDNEEDILHHKANIVKCRKAHMCVGGCGGEILPGKAALRETGFIDDVPVSCYTCIPCLDKWLDEITEAEEE